MSLFMNSHLGREGRSRSNKSGKDSDLHVEWYTAAGWNIRLYARWWMWSTVGARSMKGVITLTCVALHGEIVWDRLRIFLLFVASLSGFLPTLVSVHATHTTSGRWHTCSFVRTVSLFTVVPVRKRRPRDRGPQSAIWPNQVKWLYVRIVNNNLYYS